jgi:DNA-binding NtrC family response regulator
MKTDLAKRKQTILIVEDDKDMSDLLAGVVSGLGYETMKAESGSQAVHIASGIRLDLVILDLKLPDCNGIRVLEQLKAIDQSMQVIILTGFGSQEAVRSAMEIGAFDFLTKPFEVHELCAVVQDALMPESPTVRRGNYHA